MVEVTLATERMAGVVSRIAATGREFGPWLPKGAYLAAIQRGRILVATEDRYVYGFVWYVPRDDDCWQYQKITVDPHVRGKGVSKLLTKAVCDLADEAGAGLRLNVLTSNRVAIGLYHSFGFHIVQKSGKPPYEIYVMERNADGTVDH